MPHQLERSGARTGCETRQPWRVHQSRGSCREAGGLVSGPWHCLTWQGGGMHIPFLSRGGRQLAAVVTAVVGVLALIGAGTAASATGASGATFKPPPIKHVWVIELENEGYGQSFGHPSVDPYLARTLVGMGALLKNYYAVGHDSLDNYIAQVTGQAPDKATENDCGVWTKFKPGTVVRKP